MGPEPRDGARCFSTGVAEGAQAGGCGKSSSGGEERFHSVHSRSSLR